MNPVTKLCIQNTGAMMWILLTPGTIQREVHLVFMPQQNEHHCGKMCDDQAELALHVSNDHHQILCGIAIFVHIIPPKGVTFGNM